MTEIGKVSNEEELSGLEAEVNKPKVDLSLQQSRFSGLVAKIKEVPRAYFRPNSFERVVYRLPGIRHFLQFVYRSSHTDNQIDYQSGKDYTIEQLAEFDEKTRKMEKSWTGFTLTGTTIGSLGFLLDKPEGALFIGGMAGIIVLLTAPHLVAERYTRLRLYDENPELYSYTPPPPKKDLNAWSLKKKILVGVPAVVLVTSPVWAMIGALAGIGNNVIKYVETNYTAIIAEQERVLGIKHELVPKIIYGRDSEAGLGADDCYNPYTNTLFVRPFNMTPQNNFWDRVAY